MIVIGAGAAGIAATTALKNAGHDVVCLEATGRVGGRAHTDRSIFGVPFDMGAHWMHCAQANALVAPGRALGLDIYASPERRLMHGLEDGDDFWDQVEKNFAASEIAMQEDLEIERRTGRPTDRSFADVFSARGPWASTVRMMSGLSMARDLADISVRDMNTWAGGEDFFCREGFGHLVARLADGLPITLDCPVSSIEARAASVRVTTSERSLTARAVVVTVSVGVLAEDVIRFDPPLERTHRRALEMITMGDYNHAALLFEQGSLPLEADTWLGYRIEEEVAGVPRGGGFLCNIGGTGLTTMATGGSFSRELLAAGPQAAIDHALETLVNIFGSGLRRKFIKGHATAWRHEPFVRGSYSGALPGGSDQRAALRQPHAEHIHFAGEATHRSQQASVSGAWLEGERIAAELDIKLQA
ncbi:MAG: FAD-dependent oxidoreductase [Rubellimicrobium sp.]|nr:FAD-dependent oxidoreductase [Rubellimicrobium sp.]